MDEHAQCMGQQGSRYGFLFSSLVSTGMFFLIAVASLTSRQMFGEIYLRVSEFLHLSNTAFSLSLRESPGLGHFVCYTLLSLSLSGVLSQRRKFLAPLVAVIFGVIMELGQISIPSRDASLMDIGINILGVALGFGFYWLGQTRIKPG